MNPATLAKLTEIRESLEEEAPIEAKYTITLKLKPGVKVNVFDEILTATLAGMKQTKGVRVKRH